MCFDERGNVTHRTYQNGALVSSDLYDAFGKQRAGAADVFGFGGQAGYYTDAETGLVLCTHRFYDPQQGRFLTRDPLGYGGGINLYGYTGNNPVNGMDPLGLWTIGVGDFWDAEAIPVGPFSAGYGGEFSVSMDSHGTLSLGGSGQIQIGLGTAAETGGYGSFSPGFNTAPGQSGVGGSAYLYSGGGAEYGSGGRAAEAQVTVPIMYLNPFSPPNKTSHTPTVSGSVGVGQGAAAFIIPLGVSGSVNFNIPTLWHNFYRHLFGGPIRDFPPPKGSVHTFSHGSGGKVRIDLIPKTGRTCPEWRVVERSRSG